MKLRILQKIYIELLRNYKNNIYRRTAYNEVVEKVNISANKAKKLTQKQKTVV